MLTSGAASLYDVSVLYSTNSVRQMKDSFKRLKDQQDAIQQQQQNIEQQKLTQEQQQFDTNMQKAEAIRQQEMVNENYQKELDRINKKEIALIGTFSRQEDNLKDTNANAIPDILEISRLNQDKQNADRDHLSNLTKLSNEKKSKRIPLKSKWRKLRTKR